MEKQSVVSLKDVRSRSYLRGQLTRNLTFLKSLPINLEGVNLRTIEGRFKLFAPLLERFDTIQLKIESDAVDDENELKCQEKIRQDFEDDFFGLEGEYLKIIDRLNDQADSSGGGSANESSRNNASGSVNLPKLKLPSFDGTITEYVSFVDIFDSLVHVNIDLSDVDKLMYLKSCLGGEALNLIGSLPTTAANYEQAREILDKRYKNIRSIKHAHLKLLFDQPELNFKTKGNLRQLIDNFQKQLGALRALGEKVNNWNTMLVFITLSKLDFDTRRQFEICFANNEEPSFEELIEFLVKRCTALERLETTGNKIDVGGGFRRTKPLSMVVKHEGGSAKSSLEFRKNSVNCGVCSSTDHRIFDCPAFGRLTPKERYFRVRTMGLCLNCFSSGHLLGNCKSNGCRICGLKHNTMIHFEQKDLNQKDSKLVQSVVKEVVPERSEEPSLVCKSAISKDRFVLLFTALVKVRNNNGRYVTARALVDPGSQANFISRSFLSKLGLRSKTVEFNFEGVGESLGSVRSSISLCLHSFTETYSLSAQFMVLDSISKMIPQKEIVFPSKEILSGYRLADPFFDKPDRIDVLFSNEIFTAIIKSENNLEITDGLRIFSTRFGWIIGGSLAENKVRSNSCFNGCVLEERRFVDFDLEKFWQIEELPQFSQNKGESENLRLKDYQRDHDGKFIVNLPFKEDDFDFSWSKDFALKKFYGLEKRLCKNTEFYTLYKEFFKEYLARKYIEYVPEDEINKDNCYYFPHHGVLKSESLTTKLRVVFDGTISPSNCRSLNSTLEIGAKLQTDLVRILLRFRTFRYVFTSDIEKMYCQIKVSPDDRDFLRFFWRNDVNDKVRIFRSISLPFGLNCSPYLAISCLRELAVLHKDHFPIASQVLLEDTYMDDVLSGGNDLDALMSVASDLRQICKSGGFGLRKWRSNNQDFLNYIDVSENCRSDAYNVCVGDTKVLGLTWNPESDCVHFSLELGVPDKFTKRTVLSILAQVYDPIGLISPLVVVGKILLQKLWIRKLQWDEELSELETGEWKNFIIDLGNVSKLKFPRFVGPLEDYRIFVFCDASVKAYGVCAYLVENGKSHLIYSKSRVAPLKVLSLARLELCSAVLAARAVEFLSRSLGTDKNRFVLFTDSEIVLAWISKPSYTWKTFVANRVSEIISVTSDCLWRHVSSNENSADLVSRGSSFDKLNECSLWWHGPEWLVCWKDKKKQGKCLETELESKKFCFISVMGGEFMDNICERFSSYTKLIKVVGWVYRFYKNCRSHASTRNYRLNLTVEEVDGAEKTLIRNLQACHFQAQFSELKGNQNLRKNDPLVGLNPFIDGEGLLRVGGRLEHLKTISFDAKHPIVCPKRHKLIDLMIRHEHYRMNHVGCNGTLAVIRQKFWIVSGRVAVKRILKRCVVCYRYCPRGSQQLQGALPVERLEKVRAFYRVGVDLCGPFHARPTRKRGNTTCKIYVALFICLVTKAIHLEVVFDLSTAAFLSAFKRFVSRRGLPQIVMSDNGTNFRGAANLLDSWYSLQSRPEFEKTVVVTLLSDRITWKFIPSRSPSFGGLWEGNIKSMKSAFLKSAGSERLTFEEFSTLLTQVEAALNSRPVYALSYDNEDWNVLTPGHFLIGEPLKALPDLSTEKFRGNLGERWNHLKQIFAHFWKVWSDEYLAGLNQRMKQKIKQRNVVVDDIGVLRKEGLPPFKWPLCKVVEVFPGSDGIVRVIRVKINNTTYKRSIKDFCRLPDFRDSEMAGNVDGK